MEAGVESEEVRSSRGAAVAGGADGAAAAALVPASSVAAAASLGRGYVGCSSSSMRLEVISITCAGEAVGCWLLATIAKKAV